MVVVLVVVLDVGNDTRLLMTNIAMFILLTFDGCVNRSTERRPSVAA